MHYLSQLLLFKLAGMSRELCENMVRPGDLEDTGENRRVPDEMARAEAQAILCQNLEELKFIDQETWLLWRLDLGYINDDAFVEDLEDILVSLAHFYLDLKEDARRFAAPADTWLRPMHGTLLALGASALVGLRSRKAYLGVLLQAFGGFVDVELAAELVNAFKKCFGALPGLQLSRAERRAHPRLRRVRNKAAARGTDDPLIPGFARYLERQREQAEPACIEYSRSFALPIPFSTGIPGFIAYLERQREQAEPAYIDCSRSFALPIPVSTGRTARYLAALEFPAEPGNR